MPGSEHVSPPATSARALRHSWIIMDNSAARLDFGWTPAVSLGETLREIAEHAERHPGLAGTERSMKSPARQEGRPPLQLLSVVIPARDEEGCITATVEHLDLELRLQGIAHEIVVG